MRALAKDIPLDGIATRSRRDGSRVPILIGHTFDDRRAVLQTVRLSGQWNVRQVIKELETLVVGGTMLSFLKVLWGYPARIAIVDKLRLARLVRHQPGRPRAVADAQVVLQRNLLAVVALRNARADAADDARAAARPAIDRIALQRNPDAVDRDQRARRGHGAAGCGGCTQCDVMSLHPPMLSRAAAVDVVQTALTRRRRAGAITMSAPSRFYGDLLCTSC